MLRANDADRALCALKYSQNEKVRNAADTLVMLYLADLLQGELAVRRAEQIARGEGRA